MPIFEGESNGEDRPIEVLNITHRSWLQQQFGEVSKYSVAKQLAVGGASGWGVGFLCGKVGRAAAAGVGVSLLLVQVAHYKGYIHINWPKFHEDLTDAKRRLSKNVKRNLPGIAGEVEHFARENIFLVGGFAAGFLLGIAS